MSKRALRVWCQVPWCTWTETHPIGDAAVRALVKHIETAHELPSKKALVTLPGLESETP